MGGPPPLSSFYRAIRLDTVGSTNDEALALAQDGHREGTLVTARRQVSGRGRRGRRWDSPEGNLHLSLIVESGTSSNAATAIGFAAALSVADAAEAVLSPAIGIALKWPNDVLVSGAKMAGLLIEAASGVPGKLVLGVGVNVVHSPADTPYPATSLRAAGATGVDADTVLAYFADAFAIRYGTWLQQGFAPLRRDWLARAQGVGRPITVHLENTRFDGVFRDIDADGALLLDLGASGLKRITAGDVFFAAEQETVCR